MFDWLKKLLKYLINRKNIRIKRSSIMSGDSIEFDLNLEHWMRDMPDPLKDVPIIFLAIPGSHDSFTYNINRSSSLAPDAEPVLHKLYPLFRGTILRWSVTQKLDAWQQLLIGIRYFDLRLATKTGSQKIYFTHGLYADEISAAMRQVRDYVDSHPGEVVILDCQHFYGFTDDDHRLLMRFFIELFGRRMVPRLFESQALTLNSLNRMGQQIIIVYRNVAVYSTTEFWQPQMLPSPWPKQDTTSGLMRYLENIRRHPSTGFVHQAILTPTPSFILLRWTSNLKQKCAIPVKKDIYPKLKDFNPGPPKPHETGVPSTVNVVIADFVEMDDAVFPKTIIQLNAKLLRNMYPIVNG